MVSVFEKKIMFGLDYFWTEMYQLIWPPCHSGSHTPSRMSPIFLVLSVYVYSTS